MDNETGWAVAITGFLSVLATKVFDYLKSRTDANRAAEKDRLAEQAKIRAEENQLQAAEEIRRTEPLRDLVEYMKEQIKEVRAAHEQCHKDRLADSLIIAALRHDVEMLLEERKEKSKSAVVFPAIVLQHPTPNLNKPKGAS